MIEYLTDPFVSPYLPLSCLVPTLLLAFFFFNDTATPEIYTLSLHDALPISNSMNTKGARYCLPVPFFHIAGAGLATAAVVAKMTLHPLLAFDPLKTLQIIKQQGCEQMFGVPTMLITMLQHPEFERYRPTTLKVVLSAG